MRIKQAMISGCLLCFCLGGGLPLRAEEIGTPPEARSLQFGILPFVSTLALIKRFAPLRDYLQSRLQRSVQIVSAGDYPEFLRRTQARRYDLVLTAPHFVLLALDSGHYEAPLAFSNPLSAELVVHRDSGIQSLQDLAGKNIGLPPAEAIIALVGKDMLAKQGLTGGREPRYHHFTSHNAAYLALLAGQVQGAVISVNVLHTAMRKKEPLRVIASSREFPGLGLLLARDLPPPLRQQITTALLEMSYTPDGRAALEQMAYPGYRKAEAAEFEILRPYVEDSRRMLLEQAP